MNKKCSLIIPLYNEFANLERLIKNAELFLSDKNNELVLVDNGSKDKTLSLIQNYSKRYKNITIVKIEKNLGFGNGVYCGLIKAKNNILAYTHGDIQTDINDILIGIKEINSDNYFIKGKRMGRNFTDNLFTMLMSSFESIIFGKFLNDIHAQPNIFPKKIIKDIKNPPIGFIFDLYIYLLALKKNCKIYRIKVIFAKRDKGIGSNDKILQKFKTSYNEFISSIKLRFNSDINN